MPSPLRAQTATSGADETIPEGRSDALALRRDTVFRRSLAAADLLSAAVAVTLGVVVLDHDTPAPALLVALPAIVLVCKAVGLYDRDQNLLRKTTLEEAPALFQVATLYALLLWLGEGLLVEGQLGKHQVLGLWILLFVLMTLGRACARRIAAYFVPPERCLVLGSSTDAELVRQKLRLSGSLTAALVGRVPIEDEELDRDERDGRGPTSMWSAPAIRSATAMRRGNGHSERDGDGFPALGEMEVLGLVLVEQEIDRVIIAPGASSSEEVLEAVRLVKSLGVKVSVLPRLFEVVGSSVEFDDLHGTTLLGVRRHGLTTSSRILKRGVDLVGATLALAVLAPLVVQIALAVKLSSPGPVFFRQRRIGREGREFELIKFRTMVDGAEARKAALRARNEADGLFKIADDPRITRIGRFLRRSCLDELPQLLNVLRGDMSLVGPRPLVPDEDRRIEGWRRRRLHLVPGASGRCRARRASPCTRWRRWITSTAPTGPCGSMSSSCSGRSPTRSAGAVCD